MIPRLLGKTLQHSAREFPVVAVLGPRQSGKTTLVKSLFPSKPYVSLEDPDKRAYAQTDPRGFLAGYEKGAIFDEIQRVPELFSYLQGIVDKNRKPGMFILTGSQNFLLMQHLSQSLAGRVQILTLLPLSLEEVAMTGRVGVDHSIFKGFYPVLYSHPGGMHPTHWYPSYIQTYLERDVRQIKNIDNLSAFQKFLKLCAARTGQLLNLSSLANECGITHNTAHSWVGILEASFVIFLLKPYHENFNKRVVKTPKLYFYDTGLACSLLEISKQPYLSSHPLRGHLFETLVVSEMMKVNFNRGLPSNLYFWRDKTGHEVDAVMTRGAEMDAVEIKSGLTIAEDAFSGLDYWRKISKKQGTNFLIYAGRENQKRSRFKVLGWTQTPEVMRD